MTLRYITAITVVVIVVGVIVGALIVQNSRPSFMSSLGEMFGNIIEGTESLIEKIDINVPTVTVPGMPTISIPGLPTISLPK